jgi:hypothetical protein
VKLGLKVVECEEVDNDEDVVDDGCCWGCSNESGF